MDALNIAQPLKSALSVSSADEKLLHAEGKSYSAFVRFIRVVRVSIPAAKLSFISIPIPLQNMNQDQTYNKEFLQICRHSTLFPIIRSLTGVYMSIGRVYVSVGKGVVDTLFFDNYTRNAY